MQFRRFSNTCTDSFRGSVNRHSHVERSLVGLLLLLTSHCQAQTAASELLKRACGPMSARFSVHKSTPMPKLADPPRQDARIVIFVETIGLGNSCHFAPRIGVDGRWIGRDCAGGYVGFEVSPGDHMLCVTPWYSHPSRHSAIYQFHAKPETVEYLRAEMIFSTMGSLNTISLHIDPVNPAEGRLLLYTRKFSDSTSKKP